MEIHINTNHDDLRSIAAMLQAYANCANGTEPPALSNPAEVFGGGVVQSLASAPQPQVDADVDSAGVPYDPAFHASSKALNADGTWRKKRGLASATEPAVIAPPPPPPPAAPVVAAPPPPADASLMTFPDFMSRVTKALSNGLTMDRLMQVCAAHGSATGIIGFNQDPAKMVEVANELGLL